MKIKLTDLRFLFFGSVIGFLIHPIVVSVYLWFFSMFSGQGQLKDIRLIAQGWFARRVFIGNYVAGEINSEKGKRLILKNRFQKYPDFEVIRDNESGKIVECDILDEKDSSITVKFSNNEFSYLGIVKNMDDGKKLIASDFGAKGIFDLRVLGNSVMVFSGNELYSGELGDGPAIVQRDGVSYRAIVHKNSLELLPVK